jgi:hypothetical protein
MADVRFTVTDPKAPRREADPGIADITERIRAEVAAQTPRDTGELAAGWAVARGREDGVRLLTQAVPYWRFVEYGTRYMTARPVLGRVLARWRNG